MGQQAGLFQNTPGNCPYIIQCGVVTHLGQSAAGGTVAQLGFLTQGEQGLLAAHGSALPAQFQHFLYRHVRAIDLLRRAGKGTVMANVTAQVGQGNEYLARVADRVAVAAVPPRAGNRRQGRRVSDIRQCQGLVPVGKFASLQVSQ